MKAQVAGRPWWARRSQRILEVQQRGQQVVEHMALKVHANLRRIPVGRCEGEAEVLTVCHFGERNRLKGPDCVSVGDRSLEPLSAHLLRSAHVRLRG
jgi:hypothetical protein